MIVDGEVQRAPASGSVFMEWLHAIHFRHIHGRRIEGLADELARLMPTNTAAVLDVGSGDGLLAREIGVRLPGLVFTGVDIVPRREAFIPVALFDGERLPFDDDSFDVVMFVDVLHHATNQRQLLVEAARVAREQVIVKDHLNESRFDEWTLRAMDWVGNRHNGVPLPYDYWPAQRWLDELAAAGLGVTSFDDRVAFYPGVLNALFGRGLHVIAAARPIG
jgi:SAM-dependent methyltransferase